MSNKEITAHIRLAQSVLLEGAEEMMRYKMQRSLGKPTDLDASKIDADEQEKVWRALVPILQTATLRENIEADSMHDVTKALASGKISITEAKELMIILKVGAEITAIEQGDSLGSDSAPGVTIVLPESYSSPAKKEVK